MAACLYAVYVYVLLYYYCVNYINTETMSYFRLCKLKRNCQQLACICHGMVHVAAHRHCHA
jgi:hypothetical protein